MNPDHRPAWLPWRISGTTLEPNLLLLAKLMFLVTLRGGVFATLGDPFLPFAGFLTGSGNIQAGSAPDCDVPMSWLD